MGFVPVDVDVKLSLPDTPPCRGVQRTRPRGRTWRGDGQCDRTAHTVLPSLSTAHSPVGKLVGNAHLGEATLLI